MRITALDLSTNRIGFAAHDGTTRSITADAGAEDPARRLHELIRQLERAITLWPPLPDLVAIEAPIHMPGRAQATIRLGEVHGAVMVRLFELDIRMVWVPNASLKRHATGHGNARKERMLDRAIELGSPAQNHDEADAWLLRRMARQACGLEPMLEDHERDAIANSGVAW